MTTKRTNLYFLCVLIYFIAVSTLFQFLPLPVPNWVSTMLMQFCIHIPIVLAYLVISKQPAKECLYLKGISIKDALLCLGIGFFVQPLMSMIVVLTSVLQPNLVEASMQSEASQGLIPLLIITALQPGIFEELIFRGAIYSGYRHRGRTAAIVLSALLFGIMHMNLQQSLYAFCLGLVFASLVSRSGSILAGILPHMLINGYNCVMAYLVQTPALQEQIQAEQMAQETTLFDQILFTGIQCIICLPIVWALWRIFARRNPLIEQEHTLMYTEQKKESFWTVSMILVIIIFMVLGVIPNLHIFKSFFAQ